LATLKAVAGGDAVAIADQNRPVGGQQRAGEKNQPKRNDNQPANVHRNSVAKSSV